MPPTAKAPHDAAKLKVIRKTTTGAEHRAAGGGGDSDSILKVSGRLDERMFGAGTYERMLRRRFHDQAQQLIPSMQLFDCLSRW